MIKTTKMEEFLTLETFKVYCDNMLEHSGCDECNLIHACDFLKIEPNRWDIELELDNDSNNS